MTLFICLMATFENFEDIEAWQKARSLSKLVYEDVRSKLFSKDFGLKDQTTRSSGSIMDNIAEGFERGCNVDLFIFLQYKRAQQVRSSLNSIKL